jgi:hypothetical protein
VKIKKFLQRDGPAWETLLQNKKPLPPKRREALPTGQERKERGRRKGGAIHPLPLPCKPKEKES